MDMMRAYALVAMGGALGAVVRFAIGLQAVRWMGDGFPWGTLMVNVLGGFLMGLLASSLGESERMMRAFLGVGVLGGFTTFSAFSLETLRLFESHAPLLAMGYVAASIVLAIGACWAGLWLGRGGM